MRRCHGKEEEKQSNETILEKLEYAKNQRRSLVMVVTRERGKNSIVKKKKNRAREEL